MHDDYDYLDEHRANDRERTISIAAKNVMLERTLRVPEQAPGIILFAHGSGSSRFSREGRTAVSPKALSRQGHASAQRRTAAQRSAAAKRAARTKGPAGRAAAAKKAARTRSRTR